MGEKSGGMKRRAINSRLWTLVKERLPGGEQTMRDLVALLHQEDGSGKRLVGTEEYTSTRKLSDAQLLRLLRMVEARSKPDRPRRSSEGNTVFLVTSGERRYIKYLSHELDMSAEELEAFIARQTRGRGCKRHEQASAVIEPLERMLRERGYTCTEVRGRKWWDRPAAIAQEGDEQAFAPLRELSDEDRAEVFENAMARSDEIKRGNDGQAT